jgi:hypothetical protein
MSIIDKEVLQDRAHDLEGNGYNGLKLVLVNLTEPSPARRAFLQVYFHNSLGVDLIRNKLVTDASARKRIFPITGGHRLPGGQASGQVQVTGISTDVNDNGDDFMTLIVEPVGDYSTYTLHLDTMGVAFKKIDPLFSDIDFKFRPGCFSIDCNAGVKNLDPAPQNPKIDYLAKDYESFRHTLIAAMMKRVPGWQATSEADLDLVLLEQFSVAADELSDFQDRVMNEAYLTGARKRVSLARHARLMDYHIYQGQQASTVLALELEEGRVFEDGHRFNAGFTVWSGGEVKDNTSQEFITKRDYTLHYFLNRISLYTWGGTRPALKAGSTGADLLLHYGGKSNAETVRDYIRNGDINRLLVQEWRNPDTGGEAGGNPEKRQLLHLLPGEAGAEVLKDPITGRWFVRVHWEEKDRLRQNYCFQITCPGGTVRDVCMFHGNLVDVFHGSPRRVVFKASGKPLLENEYYFEESPRRGTVCRLPADPPLAYLNTPPGNELPCFSTLAVEITPSPDTWREVINFIHSNEQDAHFIVETDELGNSLVRFGSGKNGKIPPAEAEITCSYQVGRGTDGNIGSDKLRYFEKSLYPAVVSCRNPLAVESGRDPEPPAEIIRRVQEAYLQRQLRAITEQDYVKRAEELPEVSRAAACYMWTGSFRTVRVSIDPVGTTELTSVVRNRIARHLNAVRLIGEDLEIRPPRFVPLKIEVALCIHPEYWPEDIRVLLEGEFSDAYTQDGRMGFFHPDAWTFGRPLYASRILGRIHEIKGVDHVLSLSLRRFNEDTPREGEEEMIRVDENEIILVKNDPDHMENGFIRFSVLGGRR